MYEPARANEPGGCRDTLLLSRAVFGVLLPLVGTLAGILLLVILAVVLFVRHPALALIPLAVTVAGVALFARWERSRFRNDGS